MEHDIDRGDAVDRRGFIKKAGTVAWTVPAIQVINMTGALAGDVNTSVTTTTLPPTTVPGDCVEVHYRLKAEWQGDGWVWVTGNGNGNDCLIGDWQDILPPQGVYITGDPEKATVTHELPDCEIVKAYHKAGSDKSPNQDVECFMGDIADGGGSVTFTKDGPGISHIEFVVKCCVVPG